MLSLSDAGSAVAARVEGPLEGRPRLVGKEAWSSATGERDVDTALAPLCGVVGMPPPMIFSTAIFMPGGSTDSSADKGHKLGQAQK